MALPELPSLESIMGQVRLIQFWIEDNLILSAAIIAVIVGIVAFIIFRMARKKPEINEPLPEPPGAPAPPSPQPGVPGAPSPVAAPSLPGGPEVLSPQGGPIPSDLFGSRTFKPLARSAIPTERLILPGDEEERKLGPDLIDRLDMMMDIVKDLEKHFYKVRPEELTSDEKKWYIMVKRGIENLKEDIDFGDVEKAKTRLTNIEMNLKMFDMATKRKQS